MLEIKCTICGLTLDEPGAIILSPPHKIVINGGLSVTKLHLCVTCWDSLVDRMAEMVESLEENHG